MKKQNNAITKIVFFLIVAMLLVGTIASIVSSEITTNTLKDYSTVTQEGSIRDKSNVELVRIKLDTPVNYEVGAGYQKVAQFTLSPKQDINAIISKMEFYDLNNKNKPIAKEIDFKYLVIEQVLMTNYTEECSKSFFNRSHITCEKTEIGKYLKDVETWKDFDGNVKSYQPITIGLFTDVKLNERVEWVPTIANVKVDEWASWTASLKTGLMHYYKFDETSGTNVSDVFGGVDGVSRYDLFTTGKINNSMYFNFTTGIADTWNNINISNLTSSEVTVTENNGIAYGVDSDAGKAGLKITIGAVDVTLKRITLGTASTATMAYLYASDASTLIDAQAFSGKNATFDDLLSASTTYYLFTDANGSSRTYDYTGSASYPIASTYLSWVAGRYKTAGDSSNQAFDIISIDVKSSGTSYIAEGIRNMSTAGTFGGWFNSTNNTYNHFIASQKSPATTDGINLLIDDNYVVCNLGYAGTATSTSTVSENTWNYALCNKNSSGVFVYLNGNIEGYTADADNIQMPNQTMYLGCNLNYYDSGTTADWFSGDIDELAFWNRSLTVSEMDELYNFGDGCSYDICFVNNSVSLIAPANSVIFTTTPVNLSVKAVSYTEATNLNITIHLYNGTSVVAVSSNTSSFNNTATNFSIAIVPVNASYTWYAVFNDSLGMHSTSNRTFNYTYIPLDKPIQIKNFTNISLTFHQGDFPFDALYTYWNNSATSGMVSGNNSMVFSFFNNDTQQTVNVSTLIPDYPYYFSEGQPQYLLTSTHLTLVKGIALNDTYQVPLLYGIGSYWSNYSFYVTPYGCNDAGCTAGNQFFVNISDVQDTTITNDITLFSSIASSFSAFFPQSTSMTTTQKMGIAGSFILISALVILFGASTFFDTSSLIILVGLVSVLEVIFFTSIGYIPFPITVLIGLVALAILFFRSRS